MGVALMVSTSTLCRICFKPLFVADAEALFFIDDQKSKIGKDDILRKQAMRPNQNIDFARRQVFERALYFFGAAESAGQFNPYGK